MTCLLLIDVINALMNTSAITCLLNVDIIEALALLNSSKQHESGVAHPIACVPSDGLVGLCLT